MATRAYRGKGVGRRGTGCIALARMTDAGLGPLGWFAPMYRDCVGAAGADFAEFVAGRIATDHRTQHLLLRCRTADEMQSVQTAFLADAASAYNAETGSAVRIVPPVAARGEAAVS